MVDVAPPQEVQEPKPTNPLVVVHSLLRGRYPLAILLAILGAAIGGPIGYLSVKPEYRGTGVIEVRSTLPRILYETEQNQRIADFGSYLLTQVELLRSSRVVGLAMQDPEWRSLGRGLQPEQVQRFNESLEVTSPRNSQLIYVSFSDRDAKAAATAVKALIKAYEQVFVDLEIGAGNPLMSRLESIKRDQAATLKGISDRIQSIAGTFDAGSIQPIYDAKLKDWLEADEKLQEAQVSLSLGSGPNATEQPTTQFVPSTQASEQMLEVAVRSDPWLQDLERKRSTTDRELRSLKLKLGENHPRVADLQDDLEVIIQDISARKEELRELVAASAKTGSPLSTANDIGGAKINDPRIAEGVWKAKVAAYKQELDELAARKRQVDELRPEEKTARETLEATKERIRQLTVEGGPGGGRLSILSAGDVPLSPEKDRRLALTAVGALGLGGLGVGAVLLMGFLDRRIRHADAASSKFNSFDRMLGLMPEMANGMIDPASADSAAFCIHHIRAMLQIRQRASGHRLIGVTSPAPGDGKTTLVISLGMSLAATGCRTLLVDCDFDGGGLSARLRRVGTNSPPASRDSSSAESAVTNGSGLRGALAGAPLENVILNTGYKNLSLLPLGMEPGTSLGQLSPTTLHRLFSALAARFDTILVDTGPILGSVETAIVAAEAHSVILVISRNGDRVDAENASRRLAEAGAEVEGIVFNRALDADVERSVYRSYSSGRSVQRIASGDPESSADSPRNGATGNHRNGNQTRKD